MPIHVDIRINTHLIHRIHIGRLTRGGMNPDSVNEYSVVSSELQPLVHDGKVTSGFPDEPTWLEWEEGVRFTHRYGDGAEVCVQRALNALLSVDTAPAAQTALEVELAQKLAAAEQEITRLKR